MVIEPNRYLLVENNSPDTSGSEWADFTVQGYVVTDTTVNPTALSDIHTAVASGGSAQWLLLFLLAVLAFYTYHQMRMEQAQRQQAP